MLRITALALATVIGATAVAPSLAIAGDHGPCDHCTMEPIVVKGERPKKKKSQSTTQQIRQNQPSNVVVKTRN